MDIYTEQPWVLMMLYTGNWSSPHALQHCHSLLFFREFIEEGVVDYAKKNPSTVVYVSPQSCRIPKIVAEYRKCSWLCVLMGWKCPGENDVGRFSRLRRGLWLRIIGVQTGGVGLDEGEYIIYYEILLLLWKKVSVSVCVTVWSMKTARGIYL